MGISRFQKMLLCFWLLPLGLCAQQIPEHFTLLTDSLIQAGPKTYREINGPLRPYRRDTLLMAHFIEACHAENYWDGLTYAYNQMGTRFRNISAYDRSIAFHKKALEAAEKAANLEFRIFSLNMLGVVYRRREAIKTALDYNQEALELAESIENPSIGIKRSKNVSLNSIGNIFQALEQYDRAIAHFDRSLALERELGNKRGMAVNLQNMGECLEARGMLEQALYRYEQALQYDIEIGSVSGQAICHNSIARIYIKQGRAAEALPLLETAYSEALESKDQRIIVPVIVNRGWAEMEAGHLNRAESLLRDGLTLADSLNFLSNVAEAYGRLSTLKERQGAYREALAFYQKGEEYHRRITNDVNIQYVNDVLLRYDNDKKNNEIELLNRENEIVKLKLRRNKTTLLVGALLLLMFTLILYIIYRQYQLKSEKKVLTLEQSMLRSQMNPHFLFNSLNSIKLYIINNEKQNAVHYLNKFSKLVRKILEASSVREIPLEDELETARLYMNIENIRFNNEIDFSVTVSEDINAGLVRIPSLILQPFLENALWHGLSSKKADKKISVSVTRPEPGYVLITVEDNGIGREAAQKLQARKVLKRKSVGISNTTERLANFSKDYQNRFEVSIEDLYDTEGAPSGTRVSLKIPTI